MAGRPCDYCGMPTAPGTYFFYAETRNSKVYRYHRTCGIMHAFGTMVARSMKMSCTCKPRLLMVAHNCSYCMDRNVAIFLKTYGFASEEELVRWIDAETTHYDTINAQHSQPHATESVQPIPTPIGRPPTRPPEAFELAGRAVRNSY